MTDELDGMAIARQRIATEKTARTGNLDLSGLRLKILPREIRQLSWLHRLDCYGTQVADLAPIATLTNLQSLDCSFTEVADLAPIATLTNLQSLHCSHTQVADLAPIVGLFRLESLNMRGSKLRKLPPGLGRLKELEAAVNAAGIARIGISSGHPGLWLEENDLDSPLPRLIAPGNPQATRNVMAWLRGELDPDSLPDLPPDIADGTPSVPSPGAGIHVELDSTGRIILSPPGSLDREGNNRRRLEALHPELREAVQALIGELRQGNRAHPTLLARAERYQDLIDRNLDAVMFDLLYAAGVRLVNTGRAIRDALAEGRTDVAMLSPTAQEALETLLELHPGFMLATRTGQEMQSAQLEIELTAESVPILREAALEVAKAFDARPELVDPRASLSIREAAEEIGQSGNAKRDAAVTVSMTRNVIIALGQCAVAGSLSLAAAFMAGPVVGPAVGLTVLIPAAEMVKKTRQFEDLRKFGTSALERMGDLEFRAFLVRLRDHRDLMLDAEPGLRKLAKVEGPFGWLNRTLDYVRRRHDEDERDEQ